MFGLANINRALLGVFALWLAIPLPTIAKDSKHRPSMILEVGPRQMLKKPSEAAARAKHGALVMIHKGFYLDDVAVWRQSNLRIVGVGGTAQLLSTGKTAENKAIWVFTGNDVEVEHISFSGARSPEFNGAGIRFEGNNLTLRHCRFHDNEMGLLTSHEPNSVVRIENSAFHRNTVDHKRHGRLGHNIYIGRNAKLVLRESHVHGAITGHLVKSRAKSNIILYNRLTDESGRASYLIDLPEGGRGLIMGNLLHKSASAENETAISFAAEANQGQPDQELYVVYNTLVSQRRRAVLVRNHSKANALVANNLMQGEVQTLKGTGRDMSNLAIPDAGLLDADDYDFHLTPSSLAVDGAYRGITTLSGGKLQPKYQYRHPRGRETRIREGTPDIGAYELGAPPP